MADWKIHIDDVPEQLQEWSWEGNDYRRYRKHVSVALGHDGDHPFDVELVRLPPGATPCPVHEHSAMWEFFVIVAGEGEVHRNGDTAAVRAGDCFMQPAGTRHRVRNVSETDELLFYVIANEGPTQTTKHLP